MTIEKVLQTIPYEYVLGEDDEIPFDVEYEEATEGGVTLPTLSCFRLSDKKDMTATVFPTGSNTISGNIVTYKTLQALTAKEDLGVNWGATVNGRKVTYKSIMRVRSNKDF